MLVICLVLRGVHRKSFAMTQGRRSVEALDFVDNSRLPRHRRSLFMRRSVRMLSDIGPKLESTQSRTLVSRGLNLCVSETLDVGEVCVQQEMSSSGGEEGSYRPNEADLMQMRQEFRDAFSDDVEDSFCTKTQIFGILLPNRFLVCLSYNQCCVGRHHFPRRSRMMQKGRRKKKGTNLQHEFVAHVSETPIQAMNEETGT